MNILVVEDELNVRKLIQVNLEREGLTVTACENGETALELFKSQAFDLVILDWMIKGQMTGLDVCKELAGKVPVLMATARSTPTEIVLGLEMGADDYITKPFEIPVFIARVRALLRRSATLKRGAVENYTIGNLNVAVDRVEVTCEGKPIKLTASEFKILVTLVSKQGSVFSRDQLMKQVQAEGINVTERVIDTHVYSIRNKLGPCADIIETIRGIGYRIKA